jgi:hypothetical protein
VFPELHLAPGDALNWLVVLVFGHGLVWFLFQCFTWLTSWWTVAKKSARAGGVLIDAGRGTAARLSKVTPIRRLGLVFGGLAGVALQLVWLAINFFIGNLVAGALGRRPDVSADSLPHAADIGRLLIFDDISEVYLVAAALALVWTWVCAYRRRDAHRPLTPFLVPAYVYLVFGVLGGIATTAQWLLSRGHAPNGAQPVWIIVMFGSAIISALYIMATSIVAETSEGFGRLVKP